MNIVSYTEDGGMLRVVTDSESLPEFVCEVDRFPSLAALSAEMVRKESEVSARVSVRSSKVAALTAELDAEVSKNA